MKGIPVKYRNAALIAALSTLVGGSAVYTLNSVVDTAEVTKATAVIAKDKAVVAKVKTDKVEQRSIRNTGQLRTIRRVLIEKEILVRGKRGLRGGPGPKGADGRPPTRAEIASAVAQFCAGDVCRGPAGQTVSRADLVAAITEYCETHTCRGETGKPGSDGAVGADGQPGKDAPTPARMACTPDDPANPGGTYTCIPAPDPTAP